MAHPQPLRHALGHFATGVTIMTTRSPEGLDVGVTANSFNSVSLDPPLILWSLAKRAHSLDAFTSHPFFVVHILAAEQRDLSDRFARAGHDKFAGLSLARGVGDVAVLPDCAATLQCRTETWHEGGDHIILIGRVMAYETSARAPLVFYRGRYAPATALAHNEEPAICQA